MVAHHFAPCKTPMEAFERLRSVQFDPIAPGAGTLAVAGAATSPDGQVLPLQFLPAPFTIR